MNAVIEKVMSEQEFQNLDWVLHQPLRMLIRDTSKLTSEELKFAMNILTHTDFCIYLLHIKGILQSVLFVLACMPVAVNAVILAEKFNASPKIVSKCILWTTLVSFFILPFLIIVVK